MARCCRTSAWCVWSTPTSCTTASAAAPASAYAPRPPNTRGTPFDQYRAGLHHLCLRARSTADVDAVGRFVAELGARIVHPPQLDEWAPGYYSVLFEDPCGTRLEVNHVPGKGHLADDAKPPLNTGVQQRLSDK